MTKKLRVVTFSILIILLAFVGYTFLVTRHTTQTASTPSPTFAQQKKEAELVINYGGESKTYQYQFEGEKTAFDILKETADKENIPIATKQYDFGIFVDEINGYKSDQYSAWVYTVNDESVMVGADQKQIENGDKVEWKFVSE